MRLTLHWRGRPLIALDLVAASPDNDTDDGPPLQAAGHLQDSTRADPIEPDIKTFGFGAPRPESEAK